MSNQEDRFDFSDSENHGNQGERYRKSSEDKNDNGKADGINWGDKIFSMIQESAESMDFAELSHNIQKTIDVANTVIKSAMAPFDPSEQDYKVASKAKSVKMQAQAIKDKNTGNKLDYKA